eukprot:COSAG02_NODE_1731_length_11173_cov_6.039281_8_plen_64_part_00
MTSIICDNGFGAVLRCCARPAPGSERPSAYDVRTPRPSLGRFAAWVEWARARREARPRARRPS